MTTGSVYMYTCHHEQLFGKDKPSFLQNASSPEKWKVDAILPFIAGGLLVGYGSQLGSGCTSGHMLCGVSRFSARSIMASALFMTAGAASVYAFNRSEHLGPSKLELPDAKRLSVMSRDLAISLGGYAAIFFLARHKRD
eukprot:Colp12_sorted_trinity150504_noHs@2154